MRYLPHTPEDIREMLAVVGAGHVDDLFAAIPESCRKQGPLNLPGPLSEWDLSNRMGELAADGGSDWKVFLNAGCQAHHIPALVSSLASRSEFLTSYTPYQPEMSQGTLQAIFEFQTLICRLTGMEAANASMYDGATALAEAALMAQRITKRATVAVSSLVHPHWREVLRTYLTPRAGVDIVTLPALPDGRTDLSALSALESPAVLLMQSPNFWGVFEDLPAAAETIHAAGGLLVSSFSEPFAFGVSKSPGSLGADIVCGEAQGFGMGQSFGGPGLGVLACKQAHVRQIPGRLAGQTKDITGERAFVLTLSTREQHIRRGKAASNICSNAGHCALTAAIFMAAAGRTGFRAVARHNLDLAEYFKAHLAAVGFEPLGCAPTYNEFVMKAPAHFSETHTRLLGKRILAGLPLSRWYPDMDGFWLFGVTETRTKEDVDALVKEMRS